jgi:hypothetical protein
MVATDLSDASLAALETVMTQFQPSQVTLNIEVGFGDPVPSIAEYAAQTEADLCACRNTRTHGTVQGFTRQRCAGATR